MGTINNGFKDRVRYVLQHNLKSLEIEEPIGWNEDDKELARNEDYHGIFANFSNSLKFLYDGAEFINNIKEVYGIQTNLRLEKFERHPKTDQWEKSYEGYLDLSTFNDEDGIISVKFNSGGLQETIKARESEEVEITRLTSIDGDILEPIATNTVPQNGRRIFLKSLLETSETQNTTQTEIESNAGNTRIQTVGIPLNLVNKSHEEISSTSGMSHGSDTVGDVGNCFFFNAEYGPRTLKIKLKIDFRIDYVEGYAIDYSHYDIKFSKYSGTNLDLVERETLFHLDFEPYEISSAVTQLLFTGQSIVHTIDIERTVIVQQGESLAIEGYTKADFEVSSSALLRVNTVIENSKLTVEEDSYFAPSNCKFYFAHDVYDRFIQIMTGRKNAFKSNYFGRTDIGYSKNGFGAFNGYTHGFHVREFPEDTTIEENRYKPLTLSFKDLQASNEAIHNIGLGIERVGYKETVVVEDLRYFYNRNVTIKLPNEVTKLKKSVSTKYYHSGIEIGYEKGGNYEEATGLDEYNSKSTYSTFITVVKNKFNKLSSIRADSYGKEFARRKPYFRYSTQDTSYDTDVFVMDLKKNTDGTFSERLWQDDFEKAPTGVFSPETATNLRLSPLNNLLRHGWLLLAGLFTYPDKKLSYGSSSGNSKLSTQLIDGLEFAENEDVLISELGRARFESEVYEFNHEVDFELNQKINGFTIIEGEKVMNVYGLVEFIHKGKTLRGWLLNLKPNKEGNWKLLKQNR